MITRSNCCQASMHTVNGGEGTSYWVCAKCGKACDPFVSESEARRRRIMATATLEKAQGKKQPPSARDFVEKQGQKDNDYRRRI